MTDNLVSLVEQHLYQELFLHDLNWSAPDHPPVAYTDTEGQTFTATNVSSYKGLRVWVCDEKPGSKIEAELDRLIAKTSTDRLVIFHNDDEQVWRWPARRNKDNSTSTRLTSHRHRTGIANPKFATRLDAIRLPIDIVLDANTVLAKVRDAFDVETQNETRRASKLMARMYTAIEKSYPKNFDSRTRDHEISVALARILFLMFGDDTDMWETDAFRNFIHHDTPADGSTLAHQLNELFIQLDTPVGAVQPAVTGLPYVNGGIFREKITLPALDKEFRDAILDACAVDWSTISPAIFGSMFQSVRDEQARRELGEHYTSERNILKTLNPLFLDELRSEFERARTMKDEKGVLTRLWNRLGDIRFMDPACGCGNFIIVAYRELRDLELQIMERLQELTVGMQLAFDPTLSLKVTLDHFYGIEIDEWPARIAETAMFLVDRQCDLKLKERFGEAPKRLPIQLQSTIIAGNAVATDWTAVLPPSEDVVLAGNPPFVGMAWMNSDQQSDNRVAFSGLPEAKGLRTGRLDYVASWYAKALAYLRGTHGRAAFVSTNSITQGEQARTMVPLLGRCGFEVDFGHQTFKWTSEAPRAAAVHCVIVGFSAKGRPGKQRRLFTYPTLTAAPEESRPKQLNFYLVDGPDLVPEKLRAPLVQGMPMSMKGSQPTEAGHLLVDESTYDTVAADPIASKYLRKFVQGRYMLNDTPHWCLWLKDAPTKEIQGSKLIQERLAKVSASRLGSPTMSVQEFAKRPHLFTQDRQPSTRYFALPEVSSENRKWIPGRFYEPDVIAGNKLIIFPGAEDWHAALLQSSMFMTWVHIFAGRLESRPSISPGLAYFPIPFPQADEALRNKLTTAWDAIDAARTEQSGATLKQLYQDSAMPEPLRNAHDSLDAIVDHAFGSKTTCESSDERKRVLFTSYVELTSRDQLPMARKTRARK